MFGLSPFRLSARLSPVLVICAFNFISLPQTGSSSHTLELGNPVEREIKGGEIHTYELRLEAEQFVDVTIEQLGVNVRGILQKPDGTTISEADSQRGARGFEMVCAIAEASGRYVLKIRSMRELAAPGKYRVNVTEMRPATAQDRARMEAQKEFDAGELDRRKTDNDSWARADKAYYSALQKWMTVGDRRREAVTRDKLSYVNCLRFEKRKAVEFAEQSLALYRALADQSGEANALFALGNAYWMRREIAPAVEFYEQSSQLCHKIGERFSEGLALQQLILLYSKRGEKQKALACAQQSLPLLKAAGERGHEGLSWLRLGEIYASLGEKPKALAAYDQARLLFQADGQPVLVAGVLWDCGLIYAAQGEASKARAAYSEALSMFRAIGDSHIEAQLGEGRALISLGALARMQGDKQQALSYYQQALSVNPALRSISGQMSARRQLGAVYSLLGEWQQALEQTHQAWLYWRDENGDRPEEAATLYELAAIYRELGDGEQSLALYERALQLFRALDDREGEARTLAYAGAARHKLDEKPQALEQLRQAVALYRSMGVRNGEAFALKLLAAVHVSQREFAPAQAAYARALALSRAGEDRWLEGELLAALGAHHAARREPVKAIEVYAQALALCRRLGARSREVEALVGMGAAYATAGQRQKALELHQQALALAREIREPAGEAKAFFSLARIQRDAGELQAAHGSLKAALRLIESIRANVVNQELRASYLGVTREYFEAYTDLLMRMHRQNKNAGHNAEAFQASERSRARSMLELLAEPGAGQSAPAELVERERNLQRQINATAEALRTLKSKPHTAEQAADLDRQLDALFLDLQQVRDRISVAKSRQVELAEAQPLSLSEIRRQVLDADTLLLEYSLGAERSYLWAVTPDSIRSFDLPKRAVIEAQAKRVYELMTARAMKKKGETEAQGQARVAEADKQLHTEAAKLSRMLLGPVAAQLGGKRLLIVADGALQYIPFAALPEPETERRRDREIERRRDGATAPRKPSRSVSPSLRLSISPSPLVVNHEIVNLPSASTLAVLRRDLAGRASAPKMAAILADPVFSEKDERFSPAAAQTPSKQSAVSSSGAGSTAQSEALRSAVESGLMEEGGELRRLKASRKEAEALAANAPKDQFFQALDFNASRATAMSEELNQYRIVHFTAHGSINSRHPELSGLIFSLVNEKREAQDGFLRMREIYNLKLPADLVTLSACQTALGKDVRGEGLIGMTRGFMYARAARVLASLWAVRDEETASLMIAFYQHLLGKDGQMRMTPAAALREAQIEMWRSQRRSKPFYWAGFVLQGEYK